MSDFSVLDDPLGQALHDLYMTGALHTRCDFSAPWGLELPHLPSMLMFHVVLSGTCWIEVDGQLPRLLKPGDLALVPHGDGHRLVSSPGEGVRSLWDFTDPDASHRYEVIRQDGGGDTTVLVCSTVAYEGEVARSLVGSLPTLICVDATRASRSDWVFSTLRLLSTEARHPQPGGAAVVARLSDVLLILTIRLWLEEEPSHSPGWLMALRDRKIGRAMRMIHDSPAAPWTVAMLADAVAMSRSAFAARFTDLAGEPPMQYVTRWRMQLAASLLRNSSATIGDIALQLGYQSEAAFSRSFKRWSGVAPGSERKRPPSPVGPSRVPV